MNTEAQTEARAIARRVVEQHGINNPFGAEEAMCMDAITAALAAKDAELEAVKSYSIEMLHRKDEQFERAERAEARIAELTKALEPFAREADGWDADQNDGFVFHDTERLDGEHRLNVGHLRAARRALTGGKKDG